MTPMPSQVQKLMQRLMRWLLVTLLTFSAATALAYTVTPDTPLIFHAADSVSVLDDHEGRLSPAQALAQESAFLPLTSTGKLDYNHHYWVLITLRSDLDHDRELRVDMPGWEEFHTYLIDDAQQLRALPINGAFWGRYSQLSDANPFQTAIADGQSQYPVFVLKAGGTTRLLLQPLRSGSTSAQALSPTFADHARYLEIRRFGLVIEGLFAGILLAACVFGWYSALQNRDRSSVLYACWIMIALVSYSVLPVHDGSRIYEFFLKFEGLTFGPVYVTRFVGNTFGFMQAIGYVLFARSFLDLKTHLPRIYRISNVYVVLSIAWWVMVVPFWHVAVTRPTLVFAPYAIMVIAMLLTIFASAWVRYRQGVQVAKFFMFAIIPYLFFRAVFLLSTFLNVPSPFSFMESAGLGFFLQSSNTAQAVGFCCEALIMGLAVFSKNRWLQDELKREVETQNQRLEATVDARTRELAASKADTERQHQLILDSISYASRLQKAQLPRKSRLDGRFRSFDAIWEPRDTIGGDVWWVSPPDEQGRITLVLADCTGHGVPGAMLSVLASTSLERIAAANPGMGPADMLMALDQALRRGLNQDLAGTESDDGCDAAIVRIDTERRQLEFAGAKLGLIHAHADGHVDRIQPARISLGYPTPPDEAPTVHAIHYAAGDTFVIVSDGITDQVGGGDKPRAYGYRRLTELLHACSGQEAPLIAQRIRDDLHAWQGKQLRRDDMTALVFQVN